MSESGPAVVSPWCALIRTHARHTGQQTCAWRGIFWLQSQELCANNRSATFFSTWHFRTNWS